MEFISKRGRKGVIHISEYELSIINMWTEKLVREGYDVNTAKEHAVRIVSESYHD